ncbi:MAG TPA: phosphoenolpyruvate synthase [Solirubrobacteraceae bacterium]|nr:phosphoenolpyruvate synthase [Solirubrobacteraceae bacterium]
MSAPSAATGAGLELVRAFARLRREDVAYAGGKGANLGELTAAGVPVPEGFVVGAPAYAAYCTQTGLRERLRTLLEGVDVEDTAALTAASAQARELFDRTPVPPQIAAAIADAYEQLASAASADVADGETELAVAVRSSATAEDTEAASFAGMNETFLNVRGEQAVLDAVRRCWRSLFGARTVYYRAIHGFSPAQMDIAVVVQRQLRSTRAGVMFTVNPATGAREELVIEGSFGLGEAVVSGSVSPDRYLVEKRTLAIRRREVHRKELAIEYGQDGGTVTRALEEAESMRPSLSDEEVVAVAALGVRVEEHYGTPQDTEWAFDPAGSLWMLQSRPITTLGELAGAPATGTEREQEGRRGAGATSPPGGGESAGKVLLRGLGGAPGGASGPARVLGTLEDAGRMRDGDVLVTHMTAPDWTALMRRAAAIVTDSGGMTCHAAIVSRELGIPCVVGTGEATRVLRDGEMITVDATRGIVLEGDLYEGPPAGGEGSAGAGTGRAADRDARAGAAQARAGAAAGPAGAPVTGTQLLVNLSEPSQVGRVKDMRVDGVGLLRAELMVLEALAGEHPRVLIEEHRTEEFVARMADALGEFAAGFAPRPVTYRTIDFRTNEFRGLRGGERFEPHESNPMIGYRGALRYTREPDVFRLELEALVRVWDAGMTNLHVMLPFVRTTRELRRCRELIAESGLLERPGFELWVMAEVPSVLFNLADYAALGVAGISIGSNDLTQLLLGADRDSELLAETFDERDPAVTSYLRQLIPSARELGLRTSICGQAPSVHPEYAELLVRAGIDAISVNIDVVERTRALVAAAEQRVLLEQALGGAPGRGGERARDRPQVRRRR